MKQHIDNEILRQFHLGELTTVQEAKMLEHIGQCDHCAALFADSFEQDLVLMPTNLKESTIEKTRYVKTPQQSLKETFYRYCMQVSIAVCFSLVLVFTPIQDSSRIQEYTPSRYIKQIQQEINSFSEQINIFGGQQHDTEKK